MAITSAQENILANIVTTLKTINGAGNYNLNLGTNVWRTFRAPHDLSESEMPGACVIDEDDTFFNPMTANEYTLGTDIQGVMNGWPIGIIGHVKVVQDTDREGLLQKEMIKMYSDVVIAMMVDRSRGGNALSTTLFAMSKRVDWKINVGSVGLTFVIKYDFSPIDGVTT